MSSPDHAFFEYKEASLFGDDADDAKYDLLHPRVGIKSTWTNTPPGFSGPGRGISPGNSDPDPRSCLGGLFSLV